MSIAGVLARGKARHEALMSDTVTVVRGAGHGAGVYDSSTKRYTPQAGATVYTGKARIVAQTGETAGEAGGIVTSAFLLEVPAGTDIDRGDSVTITAATHDPGLVGLTVWVTGSDLDEWATARVAQCSDQRPEVPT